LNNIKTFILRQNWKYIFTFSLILWFAVNVVQALFTEVISDEAYYLVYGENLAWGYFDHPPAVGLMTFISHLFFNGNMAIRFMTVILHILTILIIWKLVDEKQPDTRKAILFLVITASMIMFTVTGFFTIPDVPFLFFTALFLLFYKKFLHSESWINTILLGFSIAGMMYSKYHAIIVVGLVLLSNIRLLLRYKVWISAILALLLLLPHIWWQVSMDFPSLKYHLSDRNSSFKWIYFFEYIPNQLVVFNPFVFCLVIFIIVKYKTNSLFERGLYFLVVGFLAFFWSMSFKAHVEPHWTVACTIPFIILIYNHSLSNQKIMRLVKWIAPVIIILILIVRILLTTELLPQKLGFYGKEKEYKSIQKIAEQLPVVFKGSYQKTSLYKFFTKHDAFLLQNIYSRQTQFIFSQNELNYIGKPVFIFGHLPGRSEQYEIDGFTFEGYKAKEFQPVNKVKIEFTLLKQELQTGDTLNIPFKIYNPTEFDFDFNHPEFPLFCKCAYIKYGVRVYDGELFEKIDILKSRDCLTNTFRTIVPDIPAGDYLFGLTLDNTFVAARNSRYVSIKILNPEK
jgi:hypothetical protein